MKKIPLTHNQVALVDDDDYEWLNKHKWYAWWNPNTRSFYAQRSSKKTDPGGSGHTISMAREIMHAQPGQEVDHKSHDTLDNQKANLRLCTNSENQYNRKATAGSTSRHKGVSWHKQNRKWRARIQYSGKHYHLGYFTDEDDAGHAYDRAAIKYFGEFAKLNFPLPRNGKLPV